MDESLTAHQSQSETRKTHFFLMVLLLGSAFLSTALVQQGWWRASVAVLGIGSFLKILLSLRSNAKGNALIIAGTILGASLPILNLLGSGALLAVECFVLAALCRTERLKLSWAFPWLLVLFVSWIADLYWTFDKDFALLLVTSPEVLREALQSIRQSLPPALGSLLIFSR